MDIVTETWRHLVNRADAHGLYLGEKQWTEKEPVTEELIRAHYAGETTIGLHTTGTNQTCKWGCWDFDSHGEVKIDHWENAKSLATNLSLQGMHPIIEDSNGRGGFHVWVIFDEPLPSAAVWEWMQGVPVVGDPERFPKQARINKFGNYVRLPGKHPKREHWSKFWDGDAWVENFADVFEVTDSTLIEVRPEHTATAPAPVAGDSPSLDRLTDLTEKSDFECFFEARDLLKDLNPDTVDKYEGWLKVGMILHRYCPTAMGLALWESWSRKSNKHQPGVCEEKWRTFSVPEKALGIGTLRLWAKEAETIEPPYGADDHAVMETLSNLMGFQVQGFKKMGDEPGKVSFFIDTPSKMIHLGGAGNILSAARFRHAIYEALSIDIPAYDAAKWRSIVRMLTSILQVTTMPEETMIGNFREVLAEYRSDKKVPTFPEELDEEKRVQFTRIIKNKDPFIQGCLFHLSMPGFNRWMTINQIAPLTEPRKTLKICGFSPVTIVSGKVCRSYYAASVENPLLG